RIADTDQVLGVDVGVVGGLPRFERLLPLALLLGLFGRLHVRLCISERRRGGAEDDGDGDGGKNSHLRPPRPAWGWPCGRCYSTAFRLLRGFCQAVCFSAGRALATSAASGAGRSDFPE